MRRRIYLMRHGDVAYFDLRGKPVPPDEVPLTDEGRKQARAAGTALSRVKFDRRKCEDMNIGSHISQPEISQQVVRARGSL